MNRKMFNEYMYSNIILISAIIVSFCENYSLLLNKYFLIIIFLIFFNYNNKAQSTSSQNKDRKTRN